MMKSLSWTSWFWSALLVVALVLLLKSDLAHADWAEKLSAEGSPAPERDAASPTGYVLGQRHFLGTHERGDTYRWVAATQQFLATGPFTFPTTYHADSPAEGRPQLLPRAYLAWLATVSWGCHVITGDPLPLAVERAALWEPVIVHLLAFVGIVLFMGFRHGLAGASLAGTFFVLFPPLAGQFLPGVLTPRTWALLLAAYALALHVPRAGASAPSAAFSIRAALATGFALWLDPAFGFPVVLLTAVIGAASVYRSAAKPTFLRWTITGAITTLLAWLVDRTPWAPTAGELRYVHPTYALAWLGLGLGLAGWHRWHADRTGRKRASFLIAGSLPLLAPLLFLQFKHGYQGWLYSGAAMRRLTSLDETQVFDTAFALLTRTSFIEVLFMALLLMGPIAMLVLAYRSKRESALPTAAVLMGGLLVLACFKVRWSVPLALVLMPLFGHLIASSASVSVRRGAWLGVALLLIGLLAWAVARPPRNAEPGAHDLPVLIHRHFAHWLASHHPGQPVTALASPELSDAIVFHGGLRVLMSTAWESYPGQVAASRILSAPEASEAEAVLQSRAVTHVVLASWDPVLPLLVKDPGLAGKDTLHARLQRWVLPRTLRPLPYQMPAVPGFQDQKLALFKVTPPQDEALALSRLAEYFVEMNRPEPARLAAQVLAKAFPDDPNAVLARALVFGHGRDRVGFEREVVRLATDAEAERVPFTWDRRVQRAITLALAGRKDLARQETEACLASATAEDVRELTPLQAYRLGALAKNLDLRFADPDLAKLVASLGAEYNAAPAPR